MKKKAKQTKQVRVRKDLHAMVSKKVRPTRRSIGGFYDEAVEEKLKKESK